MIRFIQKIINLLIEDDTELSSELTDSIETGKPIRNIENPESRMNGYVHMAASSIKSIDQYFGKEANEIYEYYLNNKGILSNEEKENILHMLFLKKFDENILNKIRKGIEVTQPYNIDK